MSRISNQLITLSQDQFQANPKAHFLEIRPMQIPQRQSWENSKKAKELRLHYPDCDESGPQRQAKSLVLRVKTHERPSWCSYNAGSETAESGQLLRRNSARRYVIGRRDGAHKGGDAEVTAETTDRTSSRLLASASFSLRIKGDDGGFPPPREEAWYGQAEAVFADVWPFSQEKALVWREALTYYQTIASKSFRSAVKQEVSP